MQYTGIREAVKETENRFFEVMFPEYFGGLGYSVKKTLYGSEKKYLASSVRRILRYVIKDKEQIEQHTSSIISGLEEIKRLIMTDVTAAYEGDPAATGIEEVILTYPAFKAISIFRFAHEFYALGIPIIPRMLTEYMHSLTGIDIHPGATIGDSFFIDHGTGVVIGETTVIGHHVKLYQHVTLGAKSFDMNDDGTLVKGIKRHPNIGNNVVIYAGATVLGGNTYIGDNAVIGGGTWVTHSVPANETVALKEQKNEKHQRVYTQVSP